jgi:hypothetical protein
MDGTGASSRAADVVVDEIKAAGGEAVPDYNNVVEGAKLVETAIKAYGRIDIIVNNAGILRDVSFVKMTEEQWQVCLHCFVCSCVFLLYPCGFLVSRFSKDSHRGHNRSTYLSIDLSTYLYIDLSTYIYIYRSIYRSTYLSIDLYIDLSVYLSIYRSIDLIYRSIYISISILFRTLYSMVYVRVPLWNLSYRLAMIPSSTKLLPNPRRCLLVPPGIDVTL